ncbi:MAG: histidine kinase [Blautia sp.]|nr:histidine kinase [Blautia sp.]MDY5032656.1 histidine kinase [Blautia sp.]
MNFKFQTKLNMVFTCVIVFAIASFSVFVHIHIFRRLQDESINNSRQICMKVSENVDTYVEKMDDITKKMISDPTLLHFLREIKTNRGSLDDYESLIRERKIADAVSNAITLTSFPYVNVYIYSENGDFQFVYNQDNSNFQKAFSSEENKEKLRNKKLVIYANKEQDEKKSSISFIRAFYDVSGNRYGYIEVQSSYKKLNEICDLNNAANVVILNESNEVVYPPKDISEEKERMLQDQLLQESEGVFRSDSLMNFSTISEYSGLQVFIRYPMQVLYSSVNLLQRTTMLFLIVICIVTIVMMFLFTRMLVKPLRDLRDSVRAVTYENMGVQYSNTDNNEIMDLKDAFQEILDNLKVSTEREIASNKAETSARLAALQAQISPHFIHNVLYSISISAREKRTEDVCSMCKQLSDMLRYTVNSNAHRVRLGEEIKCITNYLALQKQYYEDFLQYEIVVSREAEAMDIPRLSILPFVENAIQHAFEGCKPPYNICVSANVQDQKWRISIRDNGKGFDPGKIQEINDRMKADRLTVDVNSDDGNMPGLGGLGILNSLLRLNLFFENGIKFEIKNNVDSPGTEIYLEGDILCVEDEVN